MTPSQPTLTTSELNRRSLLRLGLGVAVGAGIGAGSGVVRSSPATAAAIIDAVPPVPQLAFHVSPSQSFWSRTLAKGGDKSHYKPQSLAFDSRNRRLFVLQPTNSKGPEYLTVKHVDLKTGDLISSMYVGRAGHGVAFGVEGRGTDSYIWMETDASGSGSDARGTAIQCFKYVAGKAPSGVKKYFTGSSTITCSIDGIHNRLGIRRSVGGRFRFEVYDLTGSGYATTPLALRTQPPLRRQERDSDKWLDTADMRHQGWTLYGNYLYLVADHSDASETTIFQAHLNTYVDGQTVDVARMDHHTDWSPTAAGKSLPDREIEGVGTLQPTDGQVGLYFGLGSTAATSDKRFTIYHRDGTVSATE